MRKEARALIEYGESLGFTYEGINGREHHVLVHANGDTTISATSSDWRAAANAKAEMRRIAGAGNDSPRAGTYRRSNLGSGFDMNIAVRERRHAPVRPRRDLEIRRQKVKELLGDIKRELAEHRTHIAALESGIRRHGETPGLVEMLAERNRLFEICLNAAERAEKELAEL